MAGSAPASDTSAACLSRKRDEANGSALTWPLPQSASLESLEMQDVTLKVDLETIQHHPTIDSTSGALDMAFATIDSCEG